MFNITNSVVLQTVLLLMSKNMQHIENITVNDEPDTDLDTNSSKRCYGIFGCYKLSLPWTDEILRPISLFPEPPEKINVKYCLYTRYNEDKCKDLRIMEEDFPSSLKPNQRIYFISHGFLENGKKEWLKKMTKELLKLIDCSVIIIDWGRGSGLPYPQAVANIRLVGTMTAHFINNLIKTVGIHPGLIHIIGHGLGAHMAGYAGQIMKKDFKYKLGRITGLDPAEPHFSKTHPIVRLDPTDAHFVDVIHTDAGLFISGGLGIQQPVGHVDFYPNGGINQPGCHEGVISLMKKDTSNFYKGFQQMISCNHIRSYQYFTESINPGPCYFLGTECRSWEEFQNGTCFECRNKKNCPFQTTIGLHADSYLRKGSSYRSPLKLSPTRSHVKLFIMTGSEEPFCRHHYHIVLKISDSSKSMLHGGEIGMFRITIQGDKGVANNVKLTYSDQYYEPGIVHHVTVTGEPVGKLQSATVNWEYHTSPWNPLTWRITSTPRIYISWIQIKSIEENDSLMFCPEGDVTVTTRKPLTIDKKSRQENCNLRTSSNQISDCKHITQ